MTFQLFLFCNLYTLVLFLGHLTPNEDILVCLDWLDGVRFYGISTIVDYLMTNPFLSINNSFRVCRRFSSICPSDRTLSAATTPNKMYLEAMPMKEYSAFPKAPA